MVTVPASARGFVGLAVAVFVWPVAAFVVRFGFHAAPVHVVVAVCSVPCAVALLCGRPRVFRIAATVAGTAMGAVAGLAALGLLVIGTEFGPRTALLVGVTLPVATIAPLVAAFQRAEGVEQGRPAAVVGWSAAVLSAGGWLLLFFQGPGRSGLRRERARCGRSPARPGLSADRSRP
ncbi:hypothetical protein ACWGKU_11285 [Kitasatospora sp. NPDC054768]